MGVVYKARDRQLDELVALKMLRPELWGDREHVARLKDELKLARKITHPNVLRTFDLDEADGIPFISMEYVRGVTLRFLLDRTDRLPFSAGLRLARQLCRGLAAAHAVGVLHRDIKPENLILEPNGNAKLMDFGIARPTVRLEPGRTQAGWLVGTPHYLAPEQLQGNDADQRADIYSAGVVFYEVFTGALPFAGGTPMEVMTQTLRAELAPPSQHWPEIPAALERILVTCLQREPADRYADVGQILADLDRLQRSRPMLRLTLTVDGSPRAVPLTGASAARRPRPGQRAATSPTPRSPAATARWSPRPRAGWSATSPAPTASWSTACR